MNKKMQKITTAGLAVLIGSSLLVTSVDAASLTKTLKATYNNIKVNFDGKEASPNNEPFMVDGTVYVSLRDVGQITGNTVDWRNNTVHITSGAGSVDQSALEQKQREVDFWKTKADALEKQLNELKAQETPNKGTGGTIVKPGDTAAMEKKLLEIFDEELDVTWDFDVRQHSSKDLLYVTVSYSSKSDRKDFDNISSKKLETFLKEVSFEMQQVFKGFAIEGTLEDSYKETEVGTFTYSANSKFAYTKALTSDDIRDLRNELNGRYTKLPTLRFGDENVSLNIKSIDLDYRNGVVTYKINVDLDEKYRVYWNDLKDYVVQDAIEYFLDDIEYDISDVINYEEISGAIYSVNHSSTAMVRYENQDFSKRNLY